VDSTLSDYVQQVYSEPLADSTTFQQIPYRPSFSRDYFSGGAVVASNVGFAGSSVLQFSDLLGNHQILAILNLYGNLGESDVYFAYTNLSHRTNYGLAIFQYQKDLLLFTSPQRDDLENQIHRGGSVFLTRPFNRFERMEYGITAAMVNQRIFRYDYEGGTIREIADPGDHIYVAPNLAYVHDNVLYGSTGPVNGSRSRISAEYALGGIAYTTAVLDDRHYTSLTRRLTFARRILGGASFGDDPQFFRFGGAFTYRGKDYGELIGTRAAIANVELRFPLIEALRVGFPLTLSLGGINGVVFLDAASAWNAGTDPRFFSNVGGLHTEGMHLAYGFGARMNLGYFILRYDYGREHGIERGPGESHHFLTFGPEF
jgi:outer membrane protein assembly factor BamA